MQKLLTQTDLAAELRPNGRRYTLGEEIANSVSHGVGALLSIAALVLLIVRAVSHGGGIRLAAALLMGIGLLVEYLFSTLYHAIAPEKAKRVFRVLDHCGIYLLIAGSYAPFAFVALGERGGVALGIAVWAIALHIHDLYEVLAPGAFWLLLAGGISYTVGALFYIPKKVPYLHFIFHLFTLAGSVCITLSALLFVL